MRNFRDFVSQLFDRYEGNVTVFIITLISFIFANGFDILGFKGRFGVDFANIYYFVVSFTIYFLFAILRDIFWVWGRVKIVSNPNGHQEYVKNGPFEGFDFYIGLDMVIPQGWEITDCYATLEKAIPVYYENRVLLDRKFSEWFFNKTKPEYKALRWKSPLSEDNYKINIGENSNRETVFVGKIIFGTITDAKNKTADIRTFDFCLHRLDKSAIKFNQLGLYEISIMFHWKYNNRKMISKTFNGYIYSEAKDSVHKLIVREGDYNKDKDIPKPLLHKVEEVHEEPKRNTRKTTKARKKKSSPRKAS